MQQAVVTFPGSTEHKPQTWPTDSGFLWSPFCCQQSLCPFVMPSGPRLSRPSSNAHSGAVIRQPRQIQSVCAPSSHKSQSQGDLYDAKKPGHGFQKGTPHPCTSAMARLHRSAVPGAGLTSGNCHVKRKFPHNLFFRCFVPPLILHFYGSWFFTHTVLVRAPCKVFVCRFTWALLLALYQEPSRTHQELPATIQNPLRITSNLPAAYGHHPEASMLVCSTQGKIPGKHKKKYRSVRAPCTHHATTPPDDVVGEVDVCVLCTQKRTSTLCGECHEKCCAPTQNCLFGMIHVTSVKEVEFLAIILCCVPYWEGFGVVSGLLGGFL